MALCRNLAKVASLDGTTVDAIETHVSEIAACEAPTEVMNDQPDLIAKFEERIPMARGAQPEDIAGAIAFLASADAHYITGVNLPVDGGLSASSGQPALS